MISRPEFDWEKRGSTPENGLPTINEGPEALYGEDATYIVYSASGSWCDDYCLGMLKYKGGDPLRADSWLKYDRPVFGQTASCRISRAKASDPAQRRMAVEMICRALRPRDNRG